MMQILYRTIRQWMKTRIYVGLVLPMTLLLVLIGCATGEKVEPARITANPAVTKGPSVTWLEDDREGFVIMENAQNDEAYRKDFERAVAMLNSQEYDQAIDILEKVIAQAPGVTAPFINIAIAYQHIGKLEQAEENLKAALDLMPDHPAASNAYGLLFRKTGRLAEARAIYEKSLASFPDYYPLHKNLGILCDLYLNDPECALVHYEIYSWAKPEDMQVKLWIAELRARLGRN